MPNIFLASDHHFSHPGMLKFTREDGTPLRSFGSVEEMDQHMIDRHNAVVKPNDLVYFLGDVTCSKTEDPLKNLYALAGRKVLIKGNHDHHPLQVYSRHFEDVKGLHELSGMVLTHVPLHPASVARWGVNVHGHMHTNNVRLENGELDPRYFCVCMEQIDYTPISLEDLKKRVPKTTTLDRPRRA